jgi:hypothetical protein
MGDFVAVVSDRQRLPVSVESGTDRIAARVRPARGLSGPSPSLRGVSCNAPKLSPAMRPNTILSSRWDDALAISPAKATIDPLHHALTTAAVRRNHHLGVSFILRRCAGVRPMFDQIVGGSVDSAA